jgi:hypothetical protein
MSMSALFRGGPAPGAPPARRAPAPIQGQLTRLLKRAAMPAVYEVGIVIAVAR